jgi:hypothetical protein
MIMEYGGNDATFAQAVKQRCAADPVFWFNAFAHTMEPKWHGDNPHIPMILYPFQADFVVAQKTYWREGHNHTIVKSREQGGTIVPAYNILHEWLFNANADFLIGSEKRDKVEGKAFGAAIFPKLDYCVKRLPQWLLPRDFVCEKPHRIQMHLINPETGCLIKGETCNENFAASGRSKGAFIDEAALIDTNNAGMLEMIHTAVGMVTRSTGFISTPRGDNYFKTLCDSEHMKHHIWHWTGNPDWQEGFYTCDSGCRVHASGGKPHSVRYDDACRVYDFDPLKIAQELDLDWAKSGSPLFDPDMSRKVRVFLQEKKPKLTRVGLDWIRTENKISAVDRIAYYRATKNWKVQVKESGNGWLRVYKFPRWCKDPKCVCKGTGLHSHIVCADCCNGLPHGDQNIAYVLDITAGLVIAEYCSRFSPDIYGEHLAMICRWFGKASGYPKDAHAGVEWNGPGITVNNVLSYCRIPQHVTLSQDPNRHTRIAPKTGVVITPHNKLTLLQEHLVPAVSRPGPDGMPLLVVPFPEFWDELEAIIKYMVEKGPVNPDAPKVGSQKKRHDDRPMALLSGLVAASVPPFGKIKGHMRKLWLPTPDPRKRNENATLSA